MKHLALLLSLLLARGAISLPRDLFYPYGPEAFDRQLPAEDEGSSPEFELSVPIAFYDEFYNSIYVNVNGILSFLTEIPNFFNVQFPLEYPVIAPLYTDVDIRGGGAVYYRETQEETLLRRASQTVSSAFTKGRNFRATSLFIVTWQDVGYYDNGVDKANMYQVVIASDGQNSYVFMHYADQGVQWIQGKGKSSRPDARAQAGIISGDGRMLTLRGSGTDQVQNLDKWTNCEVPGQWLYHVGITEPDSNVSPPDVETSATYPHSPLISSCSQGATECHSKAQCVDYRPGYCCLCQDGFYGNGRNCLQDEIPLRTNGKVSGTLNDVRLEDLDLQCYVVTTDGRTYTAISRVPEELGYDMQTLNVLGTALGWLFAKPIKSSKNGYELTGGVYNHTIEVTFPQSGHRVTVVQHFLGMDVFDQLRTEITVNGHVPSVPPDTRIDMDDYEEKLTRASPGVIKSYFTRKIKLGGENGLEIPFIVDQTMEYEECAAQPPDITTLRLKHARNYILYEAREKIVRYAMTSKITPLGDDDPCKEEKLNCGPHSTCLVENDNAKCICNKGYQYIYNEETSDKGSALCVDVNECLSGQHHCHHDALCINEPGTYRCQCKHGFQGNGFACTKLPTCTDVRCHPAAECIELPSGVPECRCKAGFIGNGLQCDPEDGANHGDHESCHIAHDCSPYATCKFDGTYYTCVCLPGYKGNGYSCEMSDILYPGHGLVYPTCVHGTCLCPEGYVYVPRGHRCEVAAIKPPGDDDEEEEIDEETDDLVVVARPLASCYEGICTCPVGYYLSKNICRPHSINKGVKGNSQNSVSCNVLSNCHPNARCVYVSGLAQYQCECNAGYEGDGYDCLEIEVSCAEVDICHPNASCLYDSRTGKNLCACNQGFDGDGTTCYPSGECNSHSDCSRNGQCLYDHVAQRYKCKCNVGFNGDGKSCELDREGACGTCNEHATCQYHPEVRQFRCECETGYVGDGRTRCEKERPGCNVLNDCGQHAACVLSSGETRYRCLCNPGYSGDGYQCISELTCDRDQSMCDPEADCVREGHQYTCRCRDGFTGDGLICRPAQRHEGQFLLVNQGMATLRIPFKPTFANRGRPIQIQYYQIAVGIDIDCLEGRVYWTDMNGKAIKSCKYDGADRENFLARDLEAPEGLALDWVSRNIYWTDSTLKRVEVASIDLPRRRKVLISEGLENPRGIAIHPGHGKLYWSDWNRKSPKIERSNMDGTGRSILVQEGLQLPNSLAIDLERDELCWADAGTKSIECMGLRNNFRRTVISQCEYPFGLAISDTHYYWTDWTTRKVESVARPSGEALDALEVPLGGSGSLFGIVVVPDKCPRISNACQSVDACPEGYLCLPNGRGGRSCICSDGEGGTLCNNNVV